MLITQADKNLLRRVGLCLKAQADELAKMYDHNWAANDEARRAKRDHDRLRREERDLGTLRKKLEVQMLSQVAP